MNNSFDIHRFWNLVKWDAMTNKKFYIRMGIGLMVAWAFIFCLNTWVGNSRMELGTDGYLAYLADMVVFMEFVAIMAAASYMFYNMSTKEQRILFLMQPASNLEKYLARLLSLTVGVFIITNISIIAADIIHQLFCLAIGSELRGSVFMHLPGIYEDAYAKPGHFLTLNMTVLHMPWIMEEYTALLFIASIHSFYTFCGSLFRRNAWLLAICSHFVLTFVGAIVVFKVGEWGMFDLIESNPETGIKVLFYTVFVIATLLTATLYWLSYKIFTRMQVINNKWFNL